MTAACTSVFGGFGVGEGDVERPAVGPVEVDVLADLMRLEDRREYEATTLQSALRHPHPVVRAQAALAIGRIGSLEGATPLRSALLDTDASVRARAAFALGELNDSSSATLMALGDILRQSASAPAGSATVAPAVEAAAALGKVGARSEWARQHLIRAAAGRCCGIPADSAWTLPEAVVQEALLAIWKLPRSDAGVAAARFRLSDPDPETRWRAAYALARAGTPAAVPDLRAALRDADHRVRELAVRGLRAAIADSAGARSLVLPELTAALQDMHPHVRVNALRAIGSYRDSSTVGAVAALLTDSNGHVAQAAAETLGLLGPAAIAPLDALSADASSRLALRGAALSALFRLAPDVAIRRLDALIASPEWLHRAYAARSITGGRWIELEPRIRRLMSDPDPRVAAAALGTVPALAGDTVPAANALYLEGLAAGDPGIRTAALRGIAGRAEPADLPVLLDAYARAESDSVMNDAALAAVDALGAIAARGAPVARSFFLRFRPPADPVLRTQVAARIGAGDWPSASPIETGRDSTFYRSAARDLLVPGLNGLAPRVRITTSNGPFVIELLPGDAPLTVQNFLGLVDRGYFRGARWHRVVPNFVLQDGDPRGDGSGGPGYSIRDEINPVRYLRGTVGMALAGPDTGGSQFFVTHSPQPHLDGGYTVFGRVVDGMDVADRVLQDDPILAIERIR